MILGYGDRRTRKFAAGGRVEAFDGIRRAAQRRLDQLAAATCLGDLRLPGNRLESLRGDLAGKYSIRINDQWRIVFLWPRGALGPSDVTIVDYH